MRKLILAATAAFLLASVPSAFAHEAKAGDLEIGHPWARATPPAAKVGGGYHLMLMELMEPIAEGAMVPVTLEFEKAGSVEVDLAGGAIGSTPSGAGHGGQPDAVPSPTHEGH